MTNNFGFTLSTEEFNKLRDLIYDRFGIHLTDAKRSLLISRLQAVLKRLHLNSFEEYYQYLVKDESLSALDELVNRVSTNFTYFYREEKHFEYFQRVFLPHWERVLNERKSKDIRIWVAGCASGEEPYTLMMLMKEYFKQNYSLWDAGILATDISQKALSFAEVGIYPEDRLHKLPETLKSRFFKPNSVGDSYEISADVKKEVTFRRFNLMNDVFPFKKKFQAIFCRNVMIYFDQPTREKLVRKYADLLEDGGMLFIGHSETLGRNHPDLQYVIPSAYRKVGP